MKDCALAALLALLAIAACDGGGGDDSSSQEPGVAPRGQAAASTSALCDVAPAPAAAAPKESLRVANFNVLHGLDETPEYPAHSTLDRRLELAAEQLDEADVDVVGMQEVSRTEANDRTLHEPGLVVERLATKLADRTGVEWHWCWFLSNPHVPGEPELQPGGGGSLSDLIATLASSRYASFQEGIAVLSRYPILAADGFRLPGRVPAEALFCPVDLEEIPPMCASTVLVESRAALWAEIDTPGGRTQIVTTHLSHGLTEASDVSALEQAAAVLVFAELKAVTSSAARRFLTCDCNSEESDDVPVIDLITGAGWTDTYASAHPDSACRAGQDPSGCTSDQDILADSSTTTSRIDYVFGRAGGCPLSILDARKVADRPQISPLPGLGSLWPSDHHGVAADVGAGC